MLWSGLAGTAFAGAGVMSPAMMWWSTNSSRKIAAPKSSGKVSVSRYNRFRQPTRRLSASESSRSAAARICSGVARLRRTRSSSGSGRRSGRARHSGGKRDTPFRRAKPGKLCVQHGDSFGGGWQERRAPRDGNGWRRRQQGAAESLVAPESSASAGSDEAQLQRGLVEQNVGIVGHQGLPEHHIRSCAGHKQVKSAYESTTYDKKKFVPRKR